MILCSLAAMLMVAPAVAGPLQQLQQRGSASAVATWLPLDSPELASLQLPPLIDSSNVDSVWALLAPSDSAAESPLPSALKRSGCAAKCAKQLAACVFACSRLSLGFGDEEAGDSFALASSCKAQCGVAAARCGAKCIFHQPVSGSAASSSAPAVIDASNVAAVLAGAEASPAATSAPAAAAGLLGAGKAKCLAKCGIASAACLATCKKATNPLLAYSEADSDGNLQMSCRAACLVHAAACAAECALGAGADSSEGEAAAVALLTATLPSAPVGGMPLELAAPSNEEADAVDSEAAEESAAAVSPAETHSQLGVDGVCLAKCGIKCAACVAVCPKKSSGPQAHAQLGFTLTCREKCAAKAAACAAICAIEP